MHKIKTPKTLGSFEKTVSTLEKTVGTFVFSKVLTVFDRHSIHSAICFSTVFFHMI